MTAMKIDRPRPVGQTEASNALLALGFRPFFLLAGLAAPVLMALWLAQWSGWLAPSDYYGVIGWHAHEMLFGYTAAVIAGFLLTAVRNWTGQPTPTGAPLGLLALLWLLGRLLPFLPVPDPVIAVVDVAFLPLVALALAGPLFRGANKVNRVMLVLLGLMSLANLMVHAEALGVAAGWVRHGQDLMLDGVLVLILMVGGRVMPFFTEMAVAGAVPVRHRGIEVATFAGALALLLADVLLGRPHPLAGGMALVLGLVQAMRLAGWHDARLWRLPMLWVLYTGYGWVVLSLLLRGLSAFDLYPASPALHAFTAGGIGVLTLGMMARVALGHTGRAIEPAAATVLAFVLVNLATALRVFGPWAVPRAAHGWIDAAGVLWMLAFTLFLVVYLPILWRPRLDGRPG